MNLQPAFLGDLIWCYISNNILTTCDVSFGAQISRRGTYFAVQISRRGANFHEGYIFCGYKFPEGYIQLHKVQR